MPPFKDGTTGDSPGERPPFQPAFPNDHVSALQFEGPPASFDRIFSAPEAPQTDKEILQAAIDSVWDAEPDDAEILPQLRLVLEMFHPATEGYSEGGRRLLPRVIQGKYVHHHVERRSLFPKGKMRDHATLALKRFVQARYPEMGPREGREGVRDYKHNYQITAEAELLRLQLAQLGRPADPLDEDVTALEERFLQVVDIAQFGMGTVPGFVKELVTTCRAHEAERELIRERRERADEVARQEARRAWFRQAGSSAVRMFRP